MCVWGVVCARTGVEGPHAGHIGPHALPLQLAGDGSFSGGGLLALSATPPRLHCWREGLSSTSLSLFYTLLGTPTPTGSYPDALVWPSGLSTMTTRPKLTSYYSLLSVHPVALLSPSFQTAPLCSCWLPMWTALFSSCTIKRQPLLRVQLRGWPWAQGGVCSQGRAGSAVEGTGTGVQAGPLPPGEFLGKLAVELRGGPGQQGGWPAGGWWGLGTRPAVWEAGELYRYVTSTQWV